MCKHLHLDTDAPPEQMRGWECEDCHEILDIGSGDMVVLPNDIFLSIANTKAVLCVACIENRLAHKLQPSDFPPHPVPIYAHCALTFVRDIVCNRLYFAQVNMEFIDP